jgi:hypothetical protein
MTILDIIHRHVFYLKLNVLETWFCLLVQVETTQLGPRDRAGLCLEKETISLPLLRPIISGDRD